ncbi:Poly(glycerol-phosphate) alpha-glucosyltransferase [Sandaracinus amylolyticus]|uniref:Poly(Glycerol-phosphate) alpha-glucosyltransferase n=2 Tax=Sandaracinus amylolyticus TaxID=927083 RepID=A0A0F6W190_9BACT|nr:Poly(glycerol-phosphate) alpha-glucosyltransferase [Sandaracinus amylolyticus]
MDKNDANVRIGISGSYGGMNLGDEAILAGIVSQLRASASAEITVFTRNVADTLARHAVDRAVPVRQLTRAEIVPEIRRLDVLVLGGGGILYDRDAEAYLREVFVAHELGVPVMLYAISAGPLVTASSMHAVRAALDRVQAITVRDRLALRLLEDVGVTRPIHLTADPALLLEPEPLPRDALLAEGVDFDRHLVGFSVREPGPAAPDIDPDEYYALLANAADFVVERYDADVVFVAMETTDVTHSHGVVAHMKNAERAEILRRRYSPGQVLDLLGRFDFAIGMRLHFLIFAALRGTPFMALPYASKVSGLLDDLGMDASPLGETGIGQLLARIDRSWDRRGEIRGTIEERIRGLRARAMRTNEHLLGLLQHAPARTTLDQIGVA